MKLVSKLVVLAFFVSLSLTVTGMACAAGDKIAYMDLGKVFDGYNKTKDMDNQLKAKGNSKEDRDAMAKTILKDIKDATDEIGKNEGYAYILDSRAVLFGSDANNLTDRVLKILNDQYTATRKK